MLIKLVKFINVQVNIELRTVCDVFVVFFGVNVTPVVLLKNRTFAYSRIYLFELLFSLNPVLMGWFDLENKPCILAKTSGLVCTTWELQTLLSGYMDCCILTNATWRFADPAKNV